MQTMRKKRTNSHKKKELTERNTFIILYFFILFYADKLKIVFGKMFNYNTPERFCIEKIDISRDIDKLSSVRIAITIIQSGYCYICDAKL